LRVIALRASSKRELLKFIKFPLSLYSQSKYYVPPLLYERKNFFNPRKNPFFDHAEVAYYLALSDRGEVLGRISAHIDWNYVEFREEDAGFFGFFDCVDDVEVAKVLLETACDFHRKKGMEWVLGPMNFNTNQEVGVLAEGFDSQPCVMMPYNFPYYLELLESCGFVKAKDLYAYWVYYDTIPRVMKRVSERVREKSGVYLRNLDVKQFASELELVRKIYNSAWENNWGFVPMTDSEIDYLAHNLKQIVDPSLAFFVYLNDRPVGFFLALPDYNIVLKEIGGRLFPFGFLKLLWGKRKIDRMRVLIMGVVEEHRHTGIEAVMLDEIYRVTPSRGYIGAEVSWILEDNLVMNRIISRLVSEPYKVYRIYGKKL
jgi:GNAT superfamily N-acetyltransferase